MKKGNAQNVSFKTLCGGQFTLIRRIWGVFLSNKKRAARVISDANNQESSVTLFNSRILVILHLLNLGLSCSKVDK